MHIGRQAWMTQTSGDLSLKDRMLLLRHSLFPVLKQSIKMYSLANRNRLAVQHELRLDDLVLPDSVYAIAFAKMQNMQRDDELLAVACLLHDLGMTEQHYQHHQHCRCFAGQGAYAARDWSLEQGGATCTC